MTRARAAIRTTLIAALGLAAAGSVQLGAAAQTQPRQCFRAQDWRGTTAGGPHDLYIRVNMHDVYHLGMAQGCSGAQSPGDVRISSVVTGSNQICSPADLDITVGPQGGSFTTPCIVTSIERLTPDQIKALPRKVVP